MSDDTNLGTSIASVLSLSRQTFETFNNFGPGDTPKTGALYTDSPRAGTASSSSEKPLTPDQVGQVLLGLLQCNPAIQKTTAECEKAKARNKRVLLGMLQSRCAAMAISQQRVPANMFQELFLGTSNQGRCAQTTAYETRDGKELCPSIALLQGSSLAEGAVMSQMNTLIAISMYNLAIANVNAEQTIWQNACASLKDMIANVDPSNIRSFKE
jgi:hypothetical protein